MTDIRTPGQLCAGETAAFFAALDGPVRAARIRPGMEVFKGRLAGDGGVLELVFSTSAGPRRRSSPARSISFTAGLRGARSKGDCKPYFEPAGETREGRILPLYRLTAGLTQSVVRKAADAASRSSLKTETKSSATACAWKTGSPRALMPCATSISRATGTRSSLPGSAPGIRGAAL